MTSPAQRNPHTALVGYDWLTDLALGIPETLRRIPRLLIKRSVNVQDR